jgi:hypothetical protein
LGFRVDNFVCQREKLRPAAIALPAIETTGNEPFDRGPTGYEPFNNRLRALRLRVASACLRPHSIEEGTTRKVLRAFFSKGSSQGHNLALTVLYVPSSLDRGG